MLLFCFLLCRWGSNSPKLTQSRVPPAGGSPLVQAFSPTPSAWDLRPPSRAPAPAFGLGTLPPRLAPLCVPKTLRLEACPVMMARPAPKVFRRDARRRAAFSAGCAASRPPRQSPSPSRAVTSVAPFWGKKIWLPFWCTPASKTAAIGSNHPKARTLREGA